MTRRNTVKEQEKSSVDWKLKVHFVEFSLEEEMDAQEWFTTQNPSWDTSLEKCLDSGWAVKISPPTKGDDWFITGQYKGTGEPYDGHSFTVRYPDFATAVCLLEWVLLSMLSDGKLDQVLEPKARAWIKA